MASDLEITVHDDGLTFPVRVVPRAKRDQIVGVEGSTLKVRVTAPPVGGKANRAVIKLLASRLGVKRSQVDIIAGVRARRKIVKVLDISEAELISSLPISDKSGAT